VEEMGLLEKKGADADATMRLLTGSSGSAGESSQAPGNTLDSLCDVGLVTWQAGIILTELLLLTHPCGAWRGTTVIDLVGVVNRHDVRWDQNKINRMFPNFPMSCQ
jgi:hypothetical protein